MQGKQGFNLLEMHKRQRSRSCATELGGRYEVYEGELIPHHLSFARKKWITEWRARELIPDKQLFAPFEITTETHLSWCFHFPLIEFQRSCRTISYVSVEIFCQTPGIRNAVMDRQRQPFPLLRVATTHSVHSNCRTASYSTR